MAGMEGAADRKNGDDPTAAATKVKFSLGKRKQVQKYVESSIREDENVESAEDSRPRTIPKLENTWKPEKAIKSDVKEFVGEVLAAGPMEGVQYGLTFVNSKGETSGTSNARNFSNSSVKRDMEIAREMRSKMEKQVLDEHLAELPDPAGLDAYDSMPIEKFGEALLRGMGWNKGDGIGLTATEDILPIAYVKRPDRLGLGATPTAKPVDEKKKRRAKPGDIPEKPTDLVAAPGPDGQIRYRVSVDEKLVERPKRGVYGGKVMCVVSGRHSGLRGKVLGDKDQVSAPGDKVTIRLQQSGETVYVEARELAELGSVDEDRALERLKNEKKKKDKSRGWLAAQIRVRVVDKRLENGKLYRKKGSVVDVLSPTACDVVMDETKHIHRLEQKHLETVVPRNPGGRVMVLKGEHRGLVAEMINRDRDSESAVVKIEQTLDVVGLSLNDIAEYTGDGC